MNLEVSLLVFFIALVLLALGAPPFLLFSLASVFYLGVAIVEFNERRELEQELFDRENLVDEEEEEDDFLLGGGLAAREKKMAEANRLTDGRQPNANLFDITDDIAYCEDRGDVMSYMHHTGGGVGSEPYSKDYLRPFPRETVNDYFGTKKLDDLEKSMVSNFGEAKVNGYLESVPKTKDGFMGSDTKYGGGCDGDVKFAKRVKYMQMQPYISEIGQAGFNAHSMKRFMEEELREQEERDWWGNDDHIYGPL
jgi:hypothetical protein